MAFLSHVSLLIHSGLVSVNETQPLAGRPAKVYTTIDNAGLLNQDKKMPRGKGHFDLLLPQPDPLYR